MHCFTISLSHGIENYFPWLWGTGISDAIFKKWCCSDQMDFRAPPIKFIAYFLLYLFQDRKLQPNTTDGYRSAISDKLGNSPSNVSKNKNLTRLLDSFHRDRPNGGRDIPSWNLTLVLHQLKKSPFEPLKEPLLKHLTFKTVFLLALGSGKCRERSSFLSKNQLAKEGPDSVAPVVTTALAHTLDRSTHWRIDHYAQLEPCTTIWTAPLTSGWIKN